MLYCPTIEFCAEDYIVTSTGNIISRKATICKPQSVEIPQGRCIICPDVIIRGDLAPVQLNRYCSIGARTSLHPCFTSTSSGDGDNKITNMKYIPQTIGADVSIGEDCVIEAAVIGTGCVIEDHCVISKRCVLKDFVHVLEGSVIPSDMVLPPFAIVAGNPARIIGEMPESTSTLGHRAAVERYKAYTLLK